MELGMLSKFQEVGVQGLMACYQQYENCLEVEQDGGGVKGGSRWILLVRNLGNRMELLVHFPPNHIWKERSTAQLSF